MLANGAFFTYARLLLHHQTGLASRYSFPMTGGPTGETAQAGRIVIDKTLAVDAAALDDFAYARSPRSSSRTRIAAARTSCGGSRPRDRFGPGR
jgi:hypothetical protein